MKTIVVIPTYNEAEGIERTLDGVLREAPDVDVLVVDDNSPDGTSTLVASHPEFMGRVHLLDRAGKDGIGEAYRAGFGWALMGGYDTIVQMDGDLSHPPDRIPDMIRALSTADVAIGSRYVPGGAIADWPWLRRAVSWMGNAYVQRLLGLGVRDATAGFKAFRREALVRIDVLDSESNGYCFQIENTWRASRLGLTIAEVPITFTDRAHGASKMSTAIVGEALLRVLVWRWRELTGRSPIPSNVPAALPTGAS